MPGCEGYGAIARVYDRLNREIDYSGWADFLETCFDRYLPARPSLVLDLACGTGSMTLSLAARGYDMIGVDGSADMLSVAYERNAGKYPILWLEQDMRSFELYGTVGAVTCCLDSLNYLLTNEELARCFSAVHNYLDPDGLFLFDMNTPYKFRTVYADNAYVLEDELPAGGEENSAPVPVYCGWQNFFSPESGICDFYLTLFEEEEDGSYRRSDEHQQERCYSMEEIRSALENAKMELLGVFSDYGFHAPEERTERWYFVARAIK